LPSGGQKQDTDNSAILRGREKGVETKEGKENPPQKNRERTGGPPPTHTGTRETVRDDPKKRPGIKGGSDVGGKGGGVRRTNIFAERLD